MPQPDKSTDKRKRQAGAIEKGEQSRVPRPDAETRAWVTANKLLGGGKKIAARRKLPSGPLGGSGRKTNAARSS